MQVIQPILLGLGMLIAETDPAVPRPPDSAHLREMLHDREHPYGQSQAALLLVQCKEDGAEKVVRAGLRQTEDADVFLALAAALRLNPDRRFVDEVFAALGASRPDVRQAAAQTLAILADGPVVSRLHALAGDTGADLAARQAALWALGRCGRKQAVRALLEQVGGDNETLRRAAAAALTDLTGQDLGMDAARWQAWWDRHKNLSNERWLETRLAYQASRACRLEGDLARARARVLRLQQQLYSRLSTAERVSHIQSLLDQDDPAVRSLAVNWALELLPAADPAHKRTLTQVLLRLSSDSAPEVQRTAVLGLGQVNDPAAAERIERLVRGSPPGVRTAALHALALQARGAGDAPARQRQIMPLLQKALEDPALEVVIEAAEDLGMLGAPEAGPVLAGLLRHASEPVRLAAAQALERVAEAAVFDALLAGLDDPCPTVRFSLVGALAHAAGDGRELSEERQKRLLARLEGLLLRDSDPGVRSRAATVLGECGPPAVLGTLWRCVLAGEDGRVQEKAWAACVDVLARAGSLPLLQEWDRTLTAARQGPRRLQLLSEIVTRWQKQPERKALVVPAQEALVQAQLELGKWSAAVPVVRELLARPASEAELNRRLRWLLAAGEQALQEGNRSEARHAVEAARPFLPSGGELANAFAKLEKQAAGEE